MKSKFWNKKTTAKYMKCKFRNIKKKNAII